MQPILPILVAISVALSLQIPAASGQAVVEGKVDLPRASKELAANQRYEASEITPAPPDFPAAIVYLEGVFAARDEGGQRPTVQMTQKNINFAPGLLAVQVGTAVEFPNLDDTYHNVFSYSKAKRFDLGRYRKDEKPGLVVFDKPGVVTTHCEVHERMRGTVLVLETPYFQKTDSEGRYRLENLPAGRYILVAWVGDKDVRRQSVELKKDGTLHVDFSSK